MESAAAKRDWSRETVLTANLEGREAEPTDCNRVLMCSRRLRIISHCLRGTRTVVIYGTMSYFRE